MHLPHTDPTYRYYIYARKSSESEEKQILSIASQIEVIKTHFPDISIVETIIESKSAFKPHNRPEFKRMLEGLQTGKADGIIAWHPDRLSRNAKDAGDLIQLLSDGVIKNFLFANYFFTNTPEGIMTLQIALSQSQYYSSKLSADVKRGLMTKLKSGWRPNVAPQGYLNDYLAEKGMKTIKIDHKRFTLLRQAWEMMLTGMYSVKYITDKLNKVWGFRTKPTRKRGNQPLSVSGLHRIFTNPFYIGDISLSDGIVIKGKHKPMVTKREFEKVQSILRGRKKGKRNHTNILQFVYKPLLTCGNCQGTITAERKFKKLLSGKVKEHRYYHCTWNKDQNCKERCVEEQKITAQLEGILKNLTIHPVFQEWAVQYLTNVLTKKQHTTQTITQNQSITLEKLEQRKKKLTSKFVDDLIEEKEYKELHHSICQEIKQLISSKQEIIQQEKSKDTTVKKRLTIMEKGVEILKEKSIEQKRELLQRIASNLYIKGQKVVPVLEKWVVNVISFKEIHKTKIDYFEPSQTLLNTDVSGDNAAMFRHWRRVVDDLRTLEERLLPIKIFEKF